MRYYISGETAARFSFTAFPDKHILVYKVNDSNNGRTLYNNRTVLVWNLLKF